MNKRGFTLIELLVAIAIIASILAAAIPNFLGARERAKDAKKKAELNQVKAALRLYYNDYQKYPADGGSPNYSLTGIKGCKADHVSSCPCDSSIDFAVGTSCETIYMKKLPVYSIGTAQYRQIDSGDNYCIKAQLENASDADIITSQQRCGNRTVYAGPCDGNPGHGSAAGSDYAVCAD